VVRYASTAGCVHGAKNVAVVAYASMAYSVHGVAQCVPSARSVVAVRYANTAGCVLHARNVGVGGLFRTWQAAFILQAMHRGETW
jgi:hypothetical protein